MASGGGSGGADDDPMGGMGLSAEQTDDEFNTTLDTTIASVAAASAT